MKNPASWGCLFVLIFVLTSPLAFGNGFDIYEQSAKAVGMAGAFAAQANDPSALFFNPAGITQLDGTHVSVGACFIAPTMKFRSNGNSVMGSVAGETAQIKDHTWTIPDAYITHKVNNKVSIGIGTFAHFGLGVDWPNSWEGRFTPGTSKTILVTTSVSPIMAIRPTEKLSIGFGPYIQHFDIDLNNYVLIGSDRTGYPVPPFSAGRNLAQTARVRLTAKDWDWGWQAGIRAKITNRLAFGASYLSEVRHKMTDGNQDVRSLANGALLVSQGFSSTFTLPAVLRLGLAWQQDSWTVEVGARWTEWATYKSLRADFDDGTYLENRKGWHNVWMWSIGGQYRVNKYLDLRAGLFYDETPIPKATVDPLVPSGDRKGYCGGVGLHFGNVTFDVGYNYIEDQGRRWNNGSGDVKLGPETLSRVTGTFYKARAHIVSVNGTYRF